MTPAGNASQDDLAIRLIKAEEQVKRLEEKVAHLQETHKMQLELMEMKMDKKLAEEKMKHTEELAKMRLHYEVNL